MCISKFLAFSAFGTTWIPFGDSDRNKTIFILTAVKFELLIDIPSSRSKNNYISFENQQVGLPVLQKNTFRLFF